MDIEFKTFDFIKGELISKEEYIFKNMYIINSGIVRSYVIATEGKVYN